MFTWIRKLYNNKKIKKKRNGQRTTSNGVLGFEPRPELSSRHSIFVRPELTSYKK